MNNNFTMYELMIMVDALEKYALECEKRMKDADMDMEREYYKRRMESANRAYKKALLVMDPKTSFSENKEI